MAEDAEMVIVPAASVPEVAVASVTMPADEGWTRRLLGREETGTPDLRLSIFRMAPGQYHPLHAHRNVGELYFVLEGRGEVRVGERYDWISAGTAVYIPQNVPHSLRTHDEGITVLVVFPHGAWEAIENIWLE
jgi:quercetin dioxygenase-like cupin family protein